MNDIREVDLSPYYVAEVQLAMTNHFRRLARHLIGRDKADELRADATWFENAGHPDDNPTRGR